MEVILRKFIASAAFTGAFFFLAVFQVGSDLNTSQKILEFPARAVSEKILENGLVVLTMARAPSRNLAAVDIKITAGSSLEGEYMGSGISHLVEHMVFKGTGTRMAGTIEKEVKSYGGIINGSTSKDTTSFHMVVPSPRLKEAMALLKDMLLSASFDKSEFEKEKEVILNEIRLRDDEPQSRLMRLLDETAYLRHAYRHPTIGYENRFRSLTREDAVKYYIRSYVPNRMVIAVVGDIDERETASIIEGQFKDFRLPDYNVLGLNLPAEPLQIAARERDASFPANLSYLAMGFHSTSVLSEDLFSMDVLAMILGRGDNSRLNVCLVKNKRLAHSISAWNYTPRDPGLFVVSAILDKQDMAPAEDEIIAQIGKMKEGDIGDEALETAKRMVLSDFIFSHQAIDALADDISSSYLLTGACDFSKRYVEGIQAVSKDDAKRAARKYLTTDNLTTVRLVSESAETVEARENPLSKAPDAIKREILPNGLRLLIREDRGLPIVSVAVAMLGGLAAETGESNGVSNFTAGMLLKGTALRKESEIAGAIEALGGSIGTFSGFNSLGLNVEVLKTDLDAALAITKDVLTNSIFPQEEIEKARQLILSDIKAEDDDIFQKGVNALRKEIFGNSCYALRQLGTEGSVKSITRQDLLNFYKSYCVPGNMVISISGDVESSSLADKLKNMFAGLKEANAPSASRPAAGMDTARTLTLEMDRRESLILLGFMTVGAHDKDRYAFDVLGSVLSGQSGRLFDNLRDRLPLAYALGCFQKTALDTGYFAFYAATSKEKIETAREALIAEIKAIRQGGVDGAELLQAKKELVTKYGLATQVNGFFSHSSALDELYGLGHDNLYRYPEEVGKVTMEDLKRIANKFFEAASRAEVVITSR